MEKKLDTILCGAALFGVIVFLLWIAVPVVRTGLSHADDAFFAILAKNNRLKTGEIVIPTCMNTDHFSVGDR